MGALVRPKNQIRMGLEFALIGTRAKDEGEGKEGKCVSYAKRLCKKTLRQWQFYLHGSAFAGYRRDI